MSRGGQITRLEMLSPAVKDGPVRRLDDQELEHEVMAV